MATRKPYKLAVCGGIICSECSCVIGDEESWVTHLRVRHAPPNDWRDDYARRVYARFERGVAAPRAVDSEELGEHEGVSRLTRE